ncbi:hypothetical protein KFL_000400030 [Klebsormidium nitens]|uniref:Uncharacterized protein n=1 Tax=Klebsormidium nitens TaxID=105231 RepID=A0A1Y1HML2_KLENI|nr:hypothetical protein KFL_000400030 [Klebsormidium nitens]|eukprot:GAQ79860.1 hypothetical protein KFL_000400030 [Klebsormidium nitens]
MQACTSSLRENGRLSSNWSSLHQVAPLYEIAAGGETINPWSLIALAVGTAALAYLSGLVMGKQLEDEAEEMETKLSEQGENGEPEPSPEPVRKRNRPIRREP